MSKAYDKAERTMPVFQSTIKMYMRTNKGYDNIKGSLQIPKSLLNKCSKGCSIALEWQANDKGWTNKKGEEPIGFIKVAGFNQVVKE